MAEVAVELSGARHRPATAVVGKAAGIGGRCEIWKQTDRDVAG